MIAPLYSTKLGQYFVGDAIELLCGKLGEDLKGNVQLIITSPPFPLNNKKRYGNLNGTEYKDWFVNLAEAFSEVLTDDGSIVIELGNAWEPERPVQSLLHLESLLEFVKHPRAGLRLCQQFICYNPARLPTPAQWVTVNRIRTVDSFTQIWWMAKQDYPKANNEKVLRPYSKSMKLLLERRKYNAGRRPSQHVVGRNSFFKDNGGSIPHNLVQLEPIDEEKDIRLPNNVFSVANTKSNDFYLRTCRERGITPHPARMPLEIACLFIEFLTDPGDLVLDPFAGSNTTGFCAEKLLRRWISVDKCEEYGGQSVIRFEDPYLDTIVRLSHSLEEG